MKILENPDKTPKYEVVTLESVNDFACIRIMEDGPFFGVTYHYLYVTPHETDDGQFILRFEYDIDEGEVKEEQKEQFEEIAAGVLLDVVTNFVEDQKLNTGAVDETASQ